MRHIIRELFQRRNLIRELVLKDLKIRYSRPSLGFLWAFLSPLLIVAIFYIVFSIIMQVKIKEAPFLLYLMTAVFSWRFFQDSLMHSVCCLVDNRNLIKESNFPHYLVPLSIVLSNSINLLASLAVLIITALVILKGVPFFIVLLPIILVVHLSLAMGMSLILSILYVRWRDTRYVLEAIMTALFYSTPAFYSLCLVKNSFSSFLFKLYIYNPLVGILNLYRLAILKGFYPMTEKDIELPSLVIGPLGFAIIFLLLGSYIYKNSKKSINDRLFY